MSSVKLLISINKTMGNLRAASVTSQNYTSMQMGNKGGHAE